MHVPAVFRRLAQHRARPTPLLAAGLAAVAAAGLAAAQSGGQDVIHACVSKTGDVRIVDPNTACPKNQTALDWNRQGPPGPQGEPGEAATRLFATADDRGIGNPDVLDESRSTPGVTLEQVRPGEYDVDFPRSLTGCAAVGSVSSSSGGLAGIDVRVLDDPDNAVRVGTAIGQPLDLPFTVAVFC